MSRQTCQVELLTPCFCAGAAQQQAEIRVPSIRGQWRWWFRALGGAPREEKDIFGGVHALEGEKRQDAAKASSLLVRVPDPAVSNRAVNLNDLQWRDAREYLLWPLRPTRGSEQRRGMLPAGATFSLEWSWRREIEPRLREKAEAALQAWLLLGAIGTRSRRGFGSVWPRDGAVTPPGGLDDLAARLAAIQKVFPKADIAVWTVAAEQPTADDALRALGQWLKEWRAGSTKSVPNPRQWGRNDHDAPLGKTDHVFRPALGLPLTQRYSGKRSFESSLEKAERWASPLHLKIARCGENRYVPLAVCFPDMAIPEGETIHIAEDTGRGQPRGPSRRVVLKHDLLKAMLKPPAGGRILVSGSPQG